LFISSFSFAELIVAVVRLNRLFARKPSSISEPGHFTCEGNAPLCHFQNSENATVARSRFADDGLGSKDESLRPSGLAQILSALSRFAT
jgi:hypothetical protein